MRPTLCLFVDSDILLIGILACYEFVTSTKHWTNEPVRVANLLLKVTESLNLC